MFFSSINRFQFFFIKYKLLYYEFKRVAIVLFASNGDQNIERFEQLVNVSLLPTLLYDVWLLVNPSILS